MLQSCALYHTHQMDAHATSPVVDLHTCLCFNAQAHSHMHARASTLTSLTNACAVSLELGGRLKDQLQQIETHKNARQASALSV